jgi:alkylated DNA repair dioxygenase AlkB
MEVLVKTDSSSLILHEIDPEIYEMLPDIISNIKDILLVHPEIKIYGKTAHQRRSVGFFSDESIGYKYSGQLMTSTNLTPELIYLLQYINEKFNSDYNGILVNYYLNGNEYIGKHSDNEKLLKKDVGVCAISFGAIRKFRIRDKKTNKIIVDCPTYPNKIIQMCGDFQEEFTHEIPIEKKVKEGRYSFTFRTHDV